MAIPGKSAAAAHQSGKLNIDFVAIGIALALAALIRLNILPNIRF